MHQQSGIQEEIEQKQRQCQFTEEIIKKLEKDLSTAIGSLEKYQKNQGSNKKVIGNMI